MKRLIRKFNYIKYRNVREMKDYFNIYTSDTIMDLIKYSVMFIITILFVLFVYNQTMIFFGSSF
jgi:hypothetical protein